MISVEVSGRFLACLRKGKLDRDKVFAAMQRASAVWGQPHLHTGRGIRQVGPRLFECRLDLATRLVFFQQGDALLFDFAGNHDQVKAYLRNRR